MTLPPSPGDPDRSAAAPAGRHVAGRYRLQQVIGRGGMGQVWQAWDDLLQRSVAVKEIRRPAALGAEEMAVLNERTFREARAAGRLANPHVVTVYDVVMQDGHPWIVMELLHASSLAEVLRQEGRLPPRRTARMGLQVLAALEEAHRHGMLHRDVKPGNVMLGTDDWVTLTDFGLATRDQDPHLTATGMLLGSPSYVAPERARSGDDVGPESDFWSLGATLYAAVEGNGPFDRSDAMATLAAVLTEEPAPVRHAGPLEGLLLGLLRKDPAARYDAATARSLLEHVAALPEEVREARPGPATVPTTVPTRMAGSPVAGGTVAGSPAGTVQVPTTTAVTAVTPPPSAYATPVLPHQPSSPASRRRRRWPWLVAALLAVVAVAAVLGYLGSRDEPDRDGTTGGATGTTPSPTPSPTPTAAPELRWRTFVSPLGYSVTVPADWEQQGTAERTDFVDRAGGRLLRIEVGPADPAGALGAWEQAEQAWQDKPGYELLRLESVDYRGYDAAVWEWTDTSQGDRRRVADQAFVVGDTGYAVLLQAPPSSWSESVPVFDTALETFEPAS